MAVAIDTKSLPFVIQRNRLARERGRRGTGHELGGQLHLAAVGLRSVDHASSISAAVRLISASGWRTVVSGGENQREIGRSSSHEAEVLARSALDEGDDPFGCLAIGMGTAGESGRDPAGDPGGGRSRGGGPGESLRRADASDPPAAGGPPWVPSSGRGAGGSRSGPARLTGRPPRTGYATDRGITVRTRAMWSRKSRM